jgi:pectinesterase
MRANAKKYNIDTNRIAMLGFSAGGELAAFLGTTVGNSNLGLNQQYNILLTFLDKVFKK